jgi:EAL domain-containing protein (putative c-di-GMP-specific phosphodiesterase class I)
MAQDTVRAEALAARVLAVEAEQGSSVRRSLRTVEGPESVQTPVSSSQTQPLVLVVDDDPALLRTVSRMLGRRGYRVASAHNGEDAVALVHQEQFDAILSDIAMPGMDGIELLRRVRQHDLLVPVVMITGDPTVDTAVQALEYGALQYLTKPVANDEIASVLDKAVQLHRVARVKQQAMELLGTVGAQAIDRAGLEASLERCLQTLWIAYQPIVNLQGRCVLGYEALLRSNEPTLPHPGAVLDAAERLDALDVLGRSIRQRVARDASDSPEGSLLFVNLHVHDLVDPLLYSREEHLSSVADRVILEITERSSLDEVKDAKRRIGSLREMGFRIAVDDLGAGYAGLTSFALLEPEFVKLDMSLVREIQTSPTRQKVVRSMAALAHDMGMRVVAEGVETVAEAGTLAELGCELLQGFLFAKPMWPFPEPVWPGP